MFALGVIDMAALAVNSISFGFLLIEGVWFCTHPTFNYYNGALGIGEFPRARSST